MKKLLMTSVLILSVAGAAQAASSDVQTRSNIKTEAEVGGLYGKGNAPDNTKKTIKRAEKAIKKAVNANEPAAKPAALTLADASIAKENSAEYMIGKPVLGANNERVGTVHDIIVSQNGSIQTLVVADGGGMSVGDKKIAIDYSAAKGHNEKGEVLSSLTEEQINQAKEFSYKTDEANKQTRVIAANEISMRDVLSANLTNAQDKKIAAVTDVSLAGGKADRLIIAHDQFLGLGGKKVSVPFSQVALAKNAKGKVDFRLNEEQVAQLDGYKGTSK